MHLWQDLNQRRQTEETSVVGTDPLPGLQFARDGRTSRGPSPGPGQKVPWHLRRPRGTGARDSCFGERIHTEGEASQQLKPSHYAE